MNNKGKTVKVKEPRQPGSSQREEFLVVLEYLLLYTYDDKHMSSQSKIIEYAKNKYNMVIRRNRIGEILTHLEQLYRKHPDSFPFKLQTVNLNVKKKYYISQWQYSDELIVSIANSILNDKLKPAMIAEREIQYLLNTTANNEKRLILEEKIRKYDKKVKRLSSKTYDFYTSILVSRTQKYRVWFKLNSTKEVHSNISTKYFTLDKEYGGYIYEIIEIDDRDYVVMYIDANKSVLVTPFKNISFTDKPMDVEEWKDLVDFSLDDPKYTSIHAWINDYFKGQTGVVLNIKVKVDYENQILFKYVKRSIEEYWFPPLDYEVKEEKEMVESKDDSGNIVTTEKVVHYAYINIKSNESSFRHWYMNQNMFYDVIIIDPKELNNKYFNDMICKLKQRVEMYGE